ncbi:MAG: hypothetical protein DRJ42_12045 [Deltaproteobacteria bacterium]|nr:MAG: hypothetical protein DRJ42_12045 [Deltaproteobacteria bacterium]
MENHGWGISVETEEDASGRPPWIREAILAGQQYHARTKTPWRHNAINLFALTVLIALGSAVAWAGTIVTPVVYIPLAAFAFGNLYFAAVILVIHEASHEMFVIGQNKKLRHFINHLAGWTVAVFIATNYTVHWEVGHLEHHVRPLEPSDPQGHNIFTGRRLLLRVLGCLFVPGYLFLERTVLRKKDREGKSGSTGAAIVAFVIAWGAALTVLTLFVGWPVAVAAFLGVQVLVAFNHAKGSLEHGGAIGHEAEFYLRSRTNFFFGRRMLMPFNITMHFEHHLNGSVPWYDLVRYHRDLRPIVPAHVQEGVWNHHPLSQISGALGGVPQPTA